MHFSALVSIAEAPYQSNLHCSINYIKLIFFTVKLYKTLEACSSGTDLHFRNGLGQGLPIFKGLGATRLQSAPWWATDHQTTWCMTVLYQLLHCAPVQVLHCSTMHLCGCPLPQFHHGLLWHSLTSSSSSCTALQCPALWVGTGSRCWRREWEPRDSGYCCSKHDGGSGRWTRA